MGQIWQGCLTACVIRIQRDSNHLMNNLAVGFQNLTGSFSKRHKVAIVPSPFAPAKEDI